MDDGEVEISDHALLPNADSLINFQSPSSVDSILDEFLKNTRTCTHTHTCNPPGPDAAHTHTCFHTHTQVFASEDDENPGEKMHQKKAKKPSGNREAVRKYREKKKAHTAYLEEEVKKLRTLNQQLFRKLQGQSILEAEIMRLRSLLVDLRGKIDNELGGVVPFQKPCNYATVKEGDCGVQSPDGTVGLWCPTNLPCFRPYTGSSYPSLADMSGSANVLVSQNGNCQHAVADCQVKASAGTSTTQRPDVDAAETPAMSSSRVEQ